LGQKQVKRFVPFNITSCLSGEAPVGEKICKGSRKMEGVLNYEESVNYATSLRNG
jgi:hypothetical protein